MSHKINATQDVNVGDIFVSLWGYEQTNATFYQVVSRSPRSVLVRPIRAQTTETGFMSGRAVPLPGDYQGEAARKVPYRYNDAVIAQHGDGFKGVYLPDKYGSCQRWDGRPVSVSWYG